jgi:hypothetical protein
MIIINADGLPSHRSKHHRSNQEQGRQASTLLNQANDISQKEIVPRLPERVLMMTGKLMYKHVG